MSDLDKINPTPMFERNANKLSMAQAKLYMYLKECTDNNEKVSLGYIVDVYWKEVKGGGEALICRKCHGELSHIKYKDSEEYFKNDQSRYKYFIEQPAKTWLSHNIGALALRGFLTIIPNFDVKLIEE